MLGIGATKEPDAVREEGEIKSDDEAAVGDDTLFAEGGTNDGVAKESGVVKNEGKLCFGGERLLPKVSIKNEFGEENERQHDDESSQKAEREKIKQIFACGGRKGGEERGGHKNGKEEVDEVFISLGGEEIFLTEEKAEQNN